MFTQKECILMKILDCGSADLELLEDIEYDLDDIIDDLMENNCLSFNGILEEVFIKGAEDLANALEDKRETIREEIYAERERVIHDFEVDYPNSTEEELIGYIEDCKEWVELMDDLELIESEEFNPEEDIDYYLNYLDTYVYMKHLGFYRRWLPNELEEVEKNMGWEFYESNE